MDPTAAQLWIVAGLVPTTRGGLHAANTGAGQGEPSGRVQRLVAPDAKKPGPDECAGAPRGLPYGRYNGNGDFACDRGGRAGCPEAGETTGYPLPQKRGGDRRAVERALAGRSPVQLTAVLEDVRCHSAAPSSPCQNAVYGSGQSGVAK